MNEYFFIVLKSIYIINFIKIVFFLVINEIDIIKFDEHIFAIFSFSLFTFGSVFFRILVILGIFFKRNAAVHV